ncbi:MAG: lytic murein transglycosylase, partial [Solimonas sp.]
MTATGMLRSLCCGLALAAAAPGACALDAGREDVQKFMEDMRRKHGFEEAWLAAVIAEAQSQPRIIELMTRPAEQVMPWHAYRSHFITPERVAAGVEFWIEQRASLAAAEQATGVPTRTIAGILGVETYFGRVTGRYRVLDALATLAFDYPPRGGYFRAELEEFLLLARENQI